MNTEQRNKELEKIMEQLPGTNAEKLRTIAQALHCKEHTVRIWRLQETGRPIPTGKLNILKDWAERGGGKL